MAAVTVLHDWITEQMRDENLRLLRLRTDDDLISLWDQYDGANAPSGFSGEDIHRVMNERGLGEFCVV
jgi:hypothetical protein